MQNRTAALTFIAVAIAATACGSDSTSSPAPVVSKIVKFSATMSAAQEVPTPTGSPAGTGTFTATLDTSTNVFTYTLTFSGMTPNVTAGHIHGPAAVGVATGVILNFATLPGVTPLTLGGTSGTASGTVTLNAATTISATVNGDSLKKLILAGLTYANLHTNTNGGGEIRGQITKTP